MGSDYSVLKYLVSQFFAVIIHSRPFFPVTTTAITLVSGIIESESEPDLEMQKRAQWIKENTHEKINEPLSVIELAVFRNLDKNLNRELDIGDKTFTLTELYKILYEVKDELNAMVVKIAKKYSLDIPMQQFGGSGGGQVSLL